MCKSRYKSDFIDLDSKETRKTFFTQWVSNVILDLHTFLPIHGKRYCSLMGPATHFSNSDPKHKCRYREQSKVTNNRVGIFTSGRDTSVGGKMMPSD